MRYVVKYQDKEACLTIETYGKKIFRVLDDGKKLEISFRKVGPYTYVLQVGNRAYRIFYDGSVFYYNGVPYKIEVIEESYNKILSLLRGKDKFSGTIELRAVMPGNIIKILHKQGDTIKENEPIIVLEAMKMENEIISPIKGKVEKLLVSEGDKVQKDQLLAIIKA
jgi:biotin carboxyl carrier protein